MKILLIEDHPLKKAQLQSFLLESFPKIELEIRESYNSGLRELIFKNEDYDMLLLDISMPNYDISSEESGGDWMPFAGKQILKEMYLREIPTKAIVITMHGSFDDGTKITELDNELKHEFQDNYIGYVYYSQINVEWKIQLENLINKQIG